LGAYFAKGGHIVTKYALFTVNKFNFCRTKAALVLKNKSILTRTCAYSRIIRTVYTVSLAIKALKSGVFKILFW
jgi:hypothetical protein